MRQRWIESVRGRWIPAVAVAFALGALPPAAAAPAGSPPAAAATQVDLNTATVSELVEVPGNGQATAERIVSWREQNGPFRSVEDLMKVQGIGEKSIEKLRPHVKVAKAK
jgi:competence protein ComEA